MSPDSPARPGGRPSGARAKRSRPRGSGRARRADASEAEGTVAKAVDLLFALHDSPGPLGVTELGKRLGMPKSSAHRLLAALAKRGLVERDERSRYRPGIGLVALGHGVLEREPLLAAARPVLEEQSARLGETFFLVAARNGELTVLDKAEGTGFLRASPQVGQAVPVHATAVGKLYLAFDPALVGGIPRTAERFTERTAVTNTALARQIRRVRQRGIAVNRDEWIAGLTVVAAPVRLDDGLAAAVAVGLASARARELGALALGKRVLETADAISRRLSGRQNAGRPAEDDAAATERRS